nr:alkaline phosphatase family protein [Chloroflexota bacterium]
SWDFFMTHIMETDRLHHFFWEEMEKGNPVYAPAFLEFYRRLDSALGEIRSWLDEDTTLIVLSDHGFCSIRQEVHVNTYLVNSGYLRYRGERPESLSDVDPSSVAYSLDPGRVYLSVRGREADGWIAPGAESDRWRSEVAEALLQMTDPDSGEAMVERVDFGEDLYHGASAANGPDLVLSMRNGYDAKGSFGKPTVCFKGDSLVGMHTTPDALLSISGVPELKRRPHIQDLAPTILDMLGVPVPDEMDGHSLAESPDA